MKLRAAYALFVLTVALGASACGGESVSPQAAVAQAATKTAESETYRTSITASMTGFAPQEVRMTGTGEVDAVSQRMHMTVNYDFAGQTFGAEMAMDWPVIYMRFPAELAIPLPKGKSWIKFDLQKAGKELGIDFQQLMQAGQADPSQGLQYLRGASDVEEVGEESVRGVDATHYRGTVDFRRVARQFPELKESIENIIELSKVESVPTDVWIDDDGLVRRMRLAYQDMQFAPGQQGDMTMTMELYDFGVEVDVEPPPKDEVVDIQELLRQGG
jgi:hypothetical protein